MFGVKNTKKLSFRVTEFLIIGFLSITFVVPASAPTGRGEGGYN